MTSSPLRTSYSPSHGGFSPQRSVTDGPGFSPQRSVSDGPGESLWITYFVSRRLALDPKMTIHELESEIPRAGHGFAEMLGRSDGRTVPRGWLASVAAPRSCLPGTVLSARPGVHGLRLGSNKVHLSSVDEILGWDLFHAFRASGHHAQRDPGCLWLRGN